MSKGILVVNIPEYCYSCDFNVQVSCRIARRSCAAYYGNQIKGRPGWCPLQKLPEKKEVAPLGAESYVSGWNDCIDSLAN